MSQNCPPPLEDSGTHLIHGSLGATEATSQMASRLVQLVVVTNRQRDRQTDRPHYICSTHTHPFNGRLSRTTQVSRHQKGKTNLDLTEARDSEWQWHQLGHMQVCTSLQTD